ncbi:MAG: hypothetical protein JWO94_1596 [Verrucomicrobiaceae bacterium]|nr:hypothetical protein [Verrucomicrobiaceae bacterium]
MPLTSFVIPLFNTGGSLPLLVEEFRTLTLEGGWELVLVDDGSTDGTCERALLALQQLPAKVTLVELARNFGEHAAVLEGYRHACGRYVVNLDDDLQNPVGEAVKLVAHLRATDAEVVYSQYEEKRHHWVRNLGSRLANALATVLLDKPAHLYLSSFRALRRELVLRIVTYRGPYPYIDGLIVGATNRIGRLKVVHAPRAIGSSTYTLRKLAQLMFNMLFDFSNMPLRIATLLGCVLCLLGMVMLGDALVETLVVGRVQAGWGSLMAVITVFSGAQLVILGIIGEYVGRAFLTVSGKPQSLVRSVTIHEPIP